MSQRMQKVEMTARCASTGMPARAGTGRVGLYMCRSIPSTCLSNTRRDSIRRAGIHRGNTLMTGIHSNAGYHLDTPLRRHAMTMDRPGSRLEQAPIPGLQIGHPSMQATTVHTGRVSPSLGTGSVVIPSPSMAGHAIARWREEAVPLLDSNPGPCSPRPTTVWKGAAGSRAPTRALTRAATRGAMPRHMAATVISPVMRRVCLCTGYRVGYGRVTETVSNRDECRPSIHH